MCFGKSHCNEADPQVLSWFPTLKRAQDNSKFWAGVFALIGGVAPPAIAGLFAYILPYLVRKLNKWSGALTRGQLDKMVIRQLFIWLLVSQTREWISVLMPRFSTSSTFLYWESSGRASLFLEKILGESRLEICWIRWAIFQPKSLAHTSHKALIGCLGFREYMTRITLISVFERW